MPTVTLTVPGDVKSELKRFSWVNWSEVAREEFVRQEKVREEFERFTKIISKSRLTEEDVRELSDGVSLSLAKRYLKMLKERA